MAQKQSQHVRLPERSDMARGQKDEEGDVVKQPDARTKSQDPTLKRDEGHKPAEQKANGYSESVSCALM
jgi:hypothetical protein